MHEHIKDVCRRLAKQGFLAVAPGAVCASGRSRQVHGHGRAHEGNRAEGVRRAGHGGPRRGRRLGAKNGGNPDKLGITGFCWGGRDADLRRTQSEAQGSGVAWYGPLARADYPAQACSTCIKHQGAGARPVRRRGRRDPARQRRSCRRRSRRPGTPARNSSSIPTRRMRFHADYRSSYRKEAADDGWKRPWPGSSSTWLSGAAERPGMHRLDTVAKGRRCRSPFALLRPSRAGFAPCRRCPISCSPTCSRPCCRSRWRRSSVSALLAGLVDQLVCVSAGLLLTVALRICCPSRSTAAPSPHARLDPCSPAFSVSSCSRSWR